MRLPETIRSAVVGKLAPLAAKALYVFGSYGTPRQHPASDLDLAILPSSPIPPYDLFLLANELSSLAEIEVDLVDLSKASTVMAKEVLRTGEILINNNPAAVRDFEMRTLSDYARLNEERKSILAR